MRDATGAVCGRFGLGLRLDGSAAFAEGAEPTKADCGRVGRGLPYMRIASSAFAIRAHGCAFS